MSQPNYESMNVNVLNVAKEEYTQQLNRILSPLILQGLESIYDDALEMANEKDIIRQYQELLKEVPKWNNHMIKEECERILQVQDWMHDLVTAVFVTNVKILTSVKIVKKETQFKLKMPSFETFIHAVYIETARAFFSNPFLLYHNEPIKKINKNKKESLKIIKECIEETIRIMLPVQHILQEYMRANEDEEMDNIEKDDTLSAQDIMNTDITNNDNIRENQIKSMAKQEINNNQNMFSNNQQEEHINSELKETENDPDNESIASEDEEYEDAVEEEDDIVNNEDIRSVPINDKKSQDKIRSNMSSRETTGESRERSRMSRYREEEEDEEESNSGSE